MLKLASDENFDGDIQRGMYRQRPDLDLVRVQDVGLIAAPDVDANDFLIIPFSTRDCVDAADFAVPSSMVGPLLPYLRFPMR